MMIKHAMFAAVSLALLGLPQAATAQNSTGQISSKGPFVQANIISADANGSFRQFYVYGSTETDHQPGGPATNSSSAFVVYFSYDSRTDSYDSAIGILDATPTVDMKLGSASLDVSGTIYRFDNTPYTVSLDLSFAPDGPKETSFDISHFTVGTTKYVSKSSATYYQATVTGDASVDGVDFGNFETIFATYGVAKSAILTIGQ